MNCPSCGAENPDDAVSRFCRSCGATLEGPSDRPPHLPAAPAPGVAPRAGLGAGSLQAAVFPYGGFWIRLVAYIIDSMLLFGVYLAAAAVAMLLLAQDARGSSPAAGLLILLLYLLAPAYMVVWPPRFGGTLGLLAVGYHIVDDNGRHIGYGKAIARLLGQMVSGLALGLGYIWIAIDPRKQGWHDKIAGTFVVRKEFVREE